MVLELLILGIVVGSNNFAHEPRARVSRTVPPALAYRSGLRGLRVLGSPCRPRARASHLRPARRSGRMARPGADRGPRSVDPAGLDTQDGRCGETRPPPPPPPPPPPVAVELARPRRAVGGPERRQSRGGLRPRAGRGAGAADGDGHHAVFGHLCMGGASPRRHGTPPFRSPGRGGFRCPSAGGRGHDRVGLAVKTGGATAPCNRRRSPAPSRS